MEKCILSIVVECTNQPDEYITKTINSIVDSFQQDNKIEIILLNVKSDFDFIKQSKNIVCYRHENIIDGFHHAKENAKGEYIQFISAGDTFYKDSIVKVSEFILKNKFTLLHCTLMNINDLYQTQKVYETGKIIEHVSNDYNNLPIKLKSCIFKKKWMDQFAFSTQSKEFFEFDFLSRVLSEDNIPIANLKSVILNYAETQAFMNEEDETHLEEYLSSYVHKESISEHQQYYLLLLFKKLLDKKSIRQREEHFNDQQKELFLKLIEQIIKLISKDMIIKTSALILQYKNYFLHMKYGQEYLDEVRVKNIENDSNKAIPYVMYQDIPLFNVSSIGNFKINILESQDNILMLDGIDVFSFLGNYQIIAIDNQKKIYKPRILEWPLLDKKGFVGEKIYLGRRFCFSIPLNDIKKINFMLVGYNEQFQLIPSFGTYSHLVKKLKMSYYAKDNYIFRYRGKGISIANNTTKAHVKSELKLLAQMIKNKKISLAYMRVLYYTQKFFRKKPVWLIRDNEKRAKDSGAEMFKYYSQWEKKSVANAYFVLDKNCPDYEIMKQYGKIIKPDSFKYKLYHLLADKLIDTRGGINPQYIFKEDADYVKDLCHWEYIWLIHGIMTRNESTWTNKYVLNAKLFATCNIREYESVLESANGYGYDEKEVALTGLPRHDALNANKQKKILFLPTWRKHLAGDLVPGTSDRSYVEHFKNTDYFQFYNSLINDERLLKVMREKGYTGDFYLHPSFMKQCHDFEENDVMRVGKEPADTSQLIGECSLLLTDYSSAQFEGAYLNTPVIYPQYDADTFSDNHTGNEGYFKYEVDGFGPVCYNLDETVKAIIDYIERDCQNKEPYETRAKNFFAHRDKNNSQRVFEYILKNDQSNQNRQNQYYVKTDEKNVYLYQGDRLKTIDSITKRNEIYNSAFDLISFIRHISMGEKGFVLKASIYINEDTFKLSHHKFELCIGDSSQTIHFSEKYRKKGYDCYHFQTEISYENILLCKKSTPIMIKWMDDEGNGYYNNLKYAFLARHDTWASKKHRKLHYSEVKIIEEIKTAVFIRETVGNSAYLCIRDINKTDYEQERKKLKWAYILSRFVFFHKARKSMLCFEKFSSKYEESASVLFEKIIDNGDKNTYFIIDRDSSHYAIIPEKYKKYIILKHSFKHYFYFFLARGFIATESMNHIIELNISDPRVTMRIVKGAYDYIFLQHGVMYMYCLENRSDFIKGQGFTNYSKVVVSSQTEANHFIEYGGFDQEDLIVSGLPKFDKSYRNPDADKILIMVTSRDFEYNVIRLTPTDSTYYQFTKKIIESIPDELKSKIVVVGHPLLKEQLFSTDLKEYIPDDYIYDELLRDTRLLITDYSSISYDAFYRGCNVLFCWEDKDMCLQAMDYKLMLNENNVFADVSHEFDDLEMLIQKNYYQPQTNENINKYRKIVTYFDNQNTQRCYQYLLDHGYYGKTKFVNISKCKARKVTKKVYTGFRRTQLKVELFNDNKILIKNRDYKTFYFNNKRKTRLAIVLFVGVGRYYGVKIRHFKVCDSISKFRVSGIRFENNEFNLDELAIQNNKTLRYLKRDKEYTAEIEDGPVKDSLCLMIKGKKQYAGKIKLIYKLEDM